MKTTLAQFRQGGAALMLLLGLTLALAGQAQQSDAPATLSVQVDKPGIRISPTLYGIFFEEINCAGDGGLYAEMVRNRSFEDGSQPEHWSLLTSGSARGEMAIETDRPMSSNNPNSLRLKVLETGDGRVGVANNGYWGMALKQGDTYEFTVRARSGNGFDGALTVSLESSEGKVYAKDELRGLGRDWKLFKLSLTPDTTDPAARLVITANRPGTVWLDMVSLFPVKTWNDRVNGLRKDLAEMLAGLRPTFMRFPGGCWVEGETIKYAYRWKQTIGQPSDRRDQYNIWQYFSTHGLGYHEYLQLCEDLHAAPLFVINCGMSHQEVVPMDRLAEWVQDALDAIEYANGPTNSVWGSLRARNGHPAPFNLRHLEVGNENGGPAYQERYAVFYDAIKARYPEIKLVADTPTTSRPADIIDEHYYSNPEFFSRNADRYDSYDREGPKIYVGEYAVTQNCGRGNLRGALGEAAFMTGMERNSDVVIMASYAPLFANLNYKRWNPDLINFDSSRVYGTPSYHVQQLFSQNHGDVILPLHLTASQTTPVEVRQGAVGLGTWNTQAEYKDLKVTQGDNVLWSGDDFAQGTSGWRIRGGDWKVKDGALQQLAAGEDRRAVTGDASWRDYTYSLKARKLGGVEGFLVMFQISDQNNWVWWNIGGWGNTQHALEQCADGSKGLLGRPQGGSVETGRWYDIRIETEGPRIRCYLDGKLVHDVVPQPVRSLHAVASRSKENGEIILKVVNVSKEDQETQVNLKGVSELGPIAKVISLSGDPAAENSLDQPDKVSPKQTTFEVQAPSFGYRFPANSLTILRFSAKN
jgi:alpha-L-arabinofuranosidase